MNDFISPYVAPGCLTLRDLDSILKFVSFKFNVSSEDIKSKSRKMEFVHPRQIFCYMARKLTDKSYTDIGYFINRDHATVMHAIKECNNEYNYELQQKLDKCK